MQFIVSTTSIKVDHNILSCRHRLSLCTLRFVHVAVDSLLELVAQTCFHITTLSYSKNGTYYSKNASLQLICTTCLFPSKLCWHIRFQSISIDSRVCLKGGPQSSDSYSVNYWSDRQLRTVCYSLKVQYKILL